MANVMLKQKSLFSVQPEPSPAMPPLPLPHQEEKITRNTQHIHAWGRIGDLSWLKESLEIQTKNDPREGYSLGALCPQPHSSSPACSLWSSSCWNSWRTRFFVPLPKSTSKPQLWLPFATRYNVGLWFWPRATTRSGSKRTCRWWAGLWAEVS